MTLRTFLLAAAHPATARRAGFTSLVVGLVLTIINHGPALLSGDLTGGRLCQILLTFTVPYTVSTVSSVATRHEINSAQAASPESVLSSMADAA
ncbi:MAG: nitrate/nitrite transporter NrtS [Spartobacteria bacterium]